MDFIKYGKLILFFTVCSVSVIHSMDIPKEDKNNFIKELYPNNHERPLYAIAIARETHDDTDYPKLKTKEQVFVFSTLKFILNQDIELPMLFREHIKNKKELLERGLEFYNKLYADFGDFIEIDDKSENSIKVLFKYLEEKKDFECIFSNNLFLEKLHLCKNIIDFRLSIQEIMKSNAADVFVIINGSNLKKSNYILGGNLKKSIKDPSVFAIEKALLDFVSVENISTFFKHSFQKALEPILIKVIPEAQTNPYVLDDFYDLKAKFQNDQLYFQKETEASEFFISKLDKLRELIRDNNYLVIFNEMFFGKSSEKDLTDYAPLTYEEFLQISNCIKDLSNIKNTIFYSNFLYCNEDIKEMIGSEYINLIKNKMEKDKEIPKELFFYNSKFSLDELLKSIKATKKYKTFKNETLIYSQGNNVGTYQKFSYWEEANKFLQDENLYLFGNGKDIINTEEKENLLAKAINKYISTETCYDLEIGIRNKMKVYPAEGKIHIVISNTLPLSLINYSPESQKRFGNLPDQIPLVLHIDPHEQDLFLNPDTNIFCLDKFHTTSYKGSFNIYNSDKQKNLVLEDPLLLRPLKLAIGGNVFTFKIWNITNALDKVYKY